MRRGVRRAARERAPPGGCVTSGKVRAAAAATRKARAALAQALAAEHSARRAAGDADEARLQHYLREQLVAEMQRQGVTQADLARRVGTDPANISLMLTSRRGLGLRLLARLARALDCELHIALRGVNKTS